MNDRISPVKRLLEESADPFLDFRAHLDESNKVPVEPENVDPNDVDDDVGTPGSRFSTAASAPSAPMTRMKEAEIEKADAPLSLQEKADIVARQEHEKNIEALDALKGLGIAQVSSERGGLIRRAGGLAMILGAIWGVQTFAPGIVQRPGTVAQSPGEWKVFYDIGQSATAAARADAGNGMANSGAKAGAMAVLNSLFKNVKDSEAKIAFFSSSVQLAAAEGDNRGLASLYSQGNSWATASADIKNDYRLAMTMQSAAKKLAVISARNPVSSRNWQERAEIWRNIAAKRQVNIRGAGWKAETKEQVRSAILSARKERAANRNTGWRAGFDKAVNSAWVQYSLSAGEEIAPMPALVRAGR